MVDFKTHERTASTESRAKQIAQSLRSASSDDTVDVVSVGKNAVIRVGTILAIPVTPAEAASHKTNLDHLANLWANSIRDALNLPTLKFPEDSFRLPIGTQRSVSLVGSLALNAQIRSSSESIVKIKRTESGLELNCLGVGDAQIVAESGNAIRKLDISVRDYAAQLPQTLNVEVDGEPANGSLVSQAVEGAIRTKLAKIPGAKARFGTVSADALGPGRTREYSVWTRVSASGSYDSAGNVKVVVHNIHRDRKPDDLLWYSNSPESVTQMGSLFAQFMKQGESVRFLYHHINASSQPFIFRVEVINDTDEAAKILVRCADSKPDRNPVKAGAEVANQFFKYNATRSGEVVEIPPRSTLPISFRRMLPKDTASGLCGLELLDGPSQLQVRADALPPFELNEEWHNATYTSFPWHEAGTHPLNDYDRTSYELSDDIYPIPYQEERLTYDVGGRFGIVMIGQKPISGKNHTNNLDGNYGVLYTIKAVLRNPTSVPANIDVMFQSTSGYTAGVFLIDGVYVQTPFLGPKASCPISHYHLAPGESRVVEIQTIPVSGGAYPATLTIRPNIGK